MRLRVHARRNPIIAESGFGSANDEGQIPRALPIEKRQGGQNINVAPTQNNSSPSDAVPNKAPDPTTLVTSPLNAAPSVSSETPLPSISKVADPAPSSGVVQDVAPGQSNIPDTSAAAAVPVPTTEAPPSDPAVAAPTPAPSASAQTPDTAVAAPPATSPEISSAAPVGSAASVVATDIPSTPNASSADAPSSIISTPDATGANAIPTAVASSTPLDAAVTATSNLNTAVQTSAVGLASAAAPTSDGGSSSAAAVPIVATNSDSAAGAAVASTTGNVNDGSSSAASQPPISDSASQATAAAAASGASLSSDPTAVPNSLSSAPDPLLSGTATAGAQSLVPVLQSSGKAASAAPALQSEAVGTGPDGGVILTSAARTGSNPDATGTTGGTGSLEKTNGPLSTGPGIAGVAISISVGVIALGVIIWFIIHRVFRNRRVGRKADTPPASPLLPALNSPLPAGIARAMSQRSAASSGMGNSNFWASGQGATMTSELDKFSDKIPMPMGMPEENDMVGTQREKEYGFRSNNVGPAPLSPLLSLPYNGVNGLGAKNGGLSLFPHPSGGNNEKGPNEFPRDF